MQGVSSYPIDVIYDTPLEAIYGCHLPKLWFLQSRVRPAEYYEACRWLEILTSPFRFPFKLFVLRCVEALQFTELMPLRISEK